MKQFIVGCLVLLSACSPSPEKTAKQQPKKDSVALQSAAQYKNDSRNERR